MLIAWLFVVEKLYLFVVLMKIIAKVQLFLDHLEGTYKHCISPRNTLNRGPAQILTLKLNVTFKLESVGNVTCPRLPSFCCCSKTQNTCSK